MKFILIPPYSNPAVNWIPVLERIVERMVKRGKLDGVTLDIDKGYFLESPSEIRGEGFLAVVNAGVVNKIQEYSKKGGYDAIVLTGAIDPGFIAARVTCDIPVTGAAHSAFHVASLIGDRFAEIHPVAPSALIIRNLAIRYGLSHKLTSARFINHSTTELYKILMRCYESGKEISDDPEGKEMINALTFQCIEAIEKDRADTIIFSCEPIQPFEDDVRKKLDEAGYSEIQIVSMLPAGVEAARLMVSMKLTQAARAYPSHKLQSKPEYY